MIAPTSSTPPKAVIYARVSSKEQAEGYSIDAQLDLLRPYALAEGLQVVNEYVDEETAKKAGRTRFGEMVNYLGDNPDVRVVLCEKTDRLYRNLRDYVTIDELDLEIHLVRENEILTKDSNSHQKFFHGIKVLMARNYIDNLSEEVKKGMAKKAESGTWPGYAPLGYVNVVVGDKHKIDVDKERVAVIPKVFRWYASGRYSLQAVATMATDAGLRSRNGKVLTKSRIEALLKNPFYTGIFVWKGTTYQGDHPPMISTGLFERTQLAFKSRDRSTRKSRHDFAYTGLLKCSHCGCAITAELKKGKYIYYHCTGGKGNCPVPRITEKELEGLFGPLVQAVRIDETIAGWIREALRESHKDEKEYHNGCIEALDRRHKVIQDRVDRIYVDNLDGKVTEEFWERKSEEWLAEQIRIRASIAEHERANVSYLEDGVTIIELAQNAYSMWLRRNRPERRQLLDILLSNCTFDGVSLYPTYRKPFCWLAEGPSRINWQAWQDLNPQPPVLETGAPPIELHAYLYCNTMILGFLRRDINKQEGRSQGQRGLCVSRPDPKGCAF